jgi:membrane protein YqaA with SNARE-associated domain
MKHNPLFAKLLCVAFVAALMLPIGRAVFPLFGSMMDGLHFSAIEAVLSATIGLGIYAVMFG